MTTTNGTQSTPLDTPEAVIAKAGLAIKPAGLSPSAKLAGAAFIESFNHLADFNHSAMRGQGFWETSDKLQALASAHGLGAEMWKMRNSQLRDLIVSEMGEACEGDRKSLDSDHIEGFTMQEEELADVIIRILDMAQGRNLRIAEAVVAKMEFNTTRPYRHGGKAF